MIVIHGFETENTAMVARLRAQLPEHRFFWISDAPGSDLNPFDALHRRESFMMHVRGTDHDFAEDEIEGDFIYFLGNYQRHWKRREFDSQDLYHKFMIYKHFVREFFDRNEVEAIFFSNVPHEGLDIILELEARRRGCPMRICLQTIFADRFLAVSSLEEIGLLPAADAPERLEEARALVAQARRPPMYMKGWLGKALLKSRMRMLLRHLLATLCKSNASFWLEAGRALSYERWFLGLPKRNGVELERLKYIYFPLHLQPEMTTSALGGVFADQLLAIEALAARLPEGWKILVKENPKQTVHYRGPAFRARLESIKGVEMAGWGTASLELIRHCQIVATITGTAGWEAICVGKPAVVFGHAWFRNLAGCHSFNPQIDLAAVAATKFEAIDLEKGLARFLSGCRTGVIDSPYTVLVPAFDARENVLAVVDGVILPWLREVLGRGEGARVKAKRGDLA